MRRERYAPDDIIMRIGMLDLRLPLTSGYATMSALTK